VEYRNELLAHQAGVHELDGCSTNDARGGTPDTGRNLDVGTVSLNGTHLHQPAALLHASDAFFAL
jgi:hypothetical protein